MIPVNEPLIGKEEIKAVNEALTHGWIAQGSFVEQFEREFARFCARRYGITVVNGTAALLLAVKGLQLQPRDEVIIPSFTIISCAYAVIESGARPVLVDADPETWTMDVASIEKRITKNTKAIMPVHIYGHPADMDPIMKLAKKYNLYVIEDAAEAHGALYKGRPCGSFGNLSCFSFYANKIITSGEGGIIVTNNKSIAQKVQDLRNLCFGRKKRFIHTGLSGNFRLSNIHAAILHGQFKRIKEHVLLKRRMGYLYTKKLRGIKGLQLPVEKSWAKNVYWMYGIVLNASLGIDAETLAQRLLRNQIMTRPFFYPLHKQPVLNARGLFKNEQYPVAKHLGKYGLYLPSGLTITETQIDAVVNALKQALS